MRPRAWLGLFVVAAGLGLLLDRLALWDFGAVFATWWPTILIAIGLLQLAQEPTRFVGPVLLVAVGAVLLAHRLDVLPGDWTAYITPGLLILLGAWLVTSGSRAVRHDRHLYVSDEAWIERTAVFGGLELAIDVKALRGGVLTALFGGIEADLREAELHPDGADLEVTATFGGVTIRVPESWRVLVEGRPLFGGVEDNRPSRKRDSRTPALRVHASALFGGIDIRS